jgi:hypothetical protein
MSLEARLSTVTNELKRNLYHLKRYADRLRRLREKRPELLSDPTDSEIETIDLFVLRCFDAT